ncbi:MAG TPA: hypothetical protein ENI95_07925 [Chloroflexi bacterium]|nr:hypothetical protein [Chloroflexota bacterium]
MSDLLPEDLFPDFDQELEPSPLLREPDKGKKKSGCRVPLLALVILVLIAVISSAAGSLLLWGYLTGNIPALNQILGRAEVNVSATQTATPAPQESPAEPTDQPESSPSPDRATPSPTPTSSLPETLEATPSPAGEGGEIVQEGVVMVYVPGGSFTMGGGAAGPAHTVTLSPYYIDRYEVTNARWAACVEAGACALPAETTTYDGTPYFGIAEFDDYPVIYINWAAADAYCRWRGARLPTEAEWEMAARWNPETGEVTAYPWGDEWDATRLNYCDAGCLLTEYRDLSYDDGWPQVAPVGSFPEGSSPVGALDMAGNVAEWVADWFAPDYYALSPQEDPPGPESGTLRVVRGGSWGIGSPALLRATTRSRFSPDSENAGLGVRCAISADDLNP